MNILEQINAEQVAKLTEGKTIPTFQPGDTVIVNVKVKVVQVTSSHPNY